MRGGGGSERDREGGREEREGRVGEERGGGVEGEGEGREERRNSDTSLDGTHFSSQVLYTLPIPEIRTPYLLLPH